MKPQLSCRLRPKRCGFCLAGILLFTFLSYVRAASPLSGLASCLTAAGVRNFTTSQSNPAALLNVLDYSLKNLRFTEAGIRKPDAIILPQSEAQVQQAFACVLKGKWTLRVLSGGHSYEGLSFTASTPFVIIDLLNLNSVSVDLTSKTAWVEAGATTGELYYAISQRTSSYGFSAGTCATIGVSGHFSGGAYGMLSRKYGVSADNVIDARLVNASGHLLTSVSADPDLFWALRGGGGGTWGIVTAWKIKLLPVSTTVTAFRLWKTGKNLITNLVYRWQSVAPVAPQELFIAIYMVAINSSGTMDIGTNIFGQYLGNLDQTVALLNRVYPELGVTAADCKQGNWIQAVAYIAGVSSPTALTDRQEASRNYFKAKSDYVKTAMSKQQLAGALAILEKSTRGWILFEPYGGVLDTISPEAISFPHRKGNLYAIQYQAVWPNDTGSPDASLMAWLKSLYSYMGPYVSQSPRAAYVNYVDLDLGDGATAGHNYFLGNFPRLVQIKKRVDPHNLFHNPQSVPTSIRS